MGSAVHGYTEQGQGTLLKVKDYWANSWTSTLGALFTYAYSASFGVLQSILRLEWVHEFSDDPRPIQVFVPNQSLLVSVARPALAHDWGNLMAAIQAVLPHGLVGYLSYQAQVLAIGDNHSVEGGARYQF